MDGCGPVLVIMIVVFVIGLVILAAQESARNKELRDAEAVYRASLSSLKESPTNADLKENTLRLGRVYSNLTRNRKGVTIFDEIALMNDINAACARAGVAGPPAGGSGKPIEERLAHLRQLKEKSLISEQEYEQRRADILKEV